MVSQTRTGGFPIGFRRGGSWQENSGRLIDWAKSNMFACIDVPPDAAVAREVAESGLSVGAADLPDWQGMISADSGRRAEAIARNTAFVRECADHVKNFFVVMLPENSDRSRKENFGDMVDSYSKLMPVLEEQGGRIVIEGWPGPGAQCCTPETYRPFLKAMNSSGACLNYDPSHLIRMGIDPLRFLREFGPHVGHIHGKDTELLGERRYECGHEQPPTFAPRIPHGGPDWRYTIPGHGEMRWIEAFRILKEMGYAGMISIELEDSNFHGSEQAEKQGLLLGKQFLEGC